MKLRCTILLFGLFLPLAHAQVPDWQRQPVPYYSTAHFLQGLYGHLYASYSNLFAQKARQLPNSLKTLCHAPTAKADSALAAARTDWQSAALSWEIFSAVAIGPLIERRSLRQIDTAPARPQLIERAIKTQPQGAKAFERIGTPAKGLPALEWLLWSKPAQPGTPACHYAIEVALDVQREADALEAAFKQRAATDWEAEDEQEHASAAMTEFINQWIGGIERLRWANMEKPLRAAESGDTVPAWPLAAKNWPRAASGQTLASWLVTYGALQAFALPAAAPPAPGQGSVRLEHYLRGRGLNPLAEKLVQALHTAEGALAELITAHEKSSKNIGTKVLELTRALAALKRLAEAEIAPALQITIGFSDADGD